VSLFSALSIATSGLSGTEYAMGVMSQNISNASVAGYVAENPTISSESTLGTGTGVAIGITTRNVQTALQNSLYKQNASVAGLTTQSNSLQTISALQGSTSATSGSTSTLSDELGNLSNMITTLISSPSNATSQSEVISSAETVANSVNALSDAYQEQRQSAEDNIVSGVSSVNYDLTTIGEISGQIMSLKAQGKDVADLENQRASVMSDLSSQLSVTFTETSQGNVLIKTESGQTLPTIPASSKNISVPSTTWPLSVEPATITAMSSWPGTGDGNDIPGIMLDGNDVTSGLTGGSLGGNLTLRDTTYTKMQAQLDSFSLTLADRFNSAGLPLFTNGQGNLPSSDVTSGTPDGIIGLSGVLQVNSSYVSDPSLLVPDNSTTTLENVLSETFATSGSSVTDHTAPSSGLGVTGTISTGYSGNQGLIALATSLTANQASTVSLVSSDLDSATTVQTSLSTTISNVSGVDVDSEMSKIVALQNSYTANAKIISIVQDMFTSLLNAV
jgi:flagellar hook-associated protein 1 FlgK